MYYIRTAVAVLAATGAYAKTLTTSNGTAGCGKSHKAGYNYHDSNGNFSIVSNGTTRYYSVQVPQGYNATRSYPLIFDYHGNTDTSSEQRNNSAYFNYT